MTTWRQLSWRSASSGQRLRHIYIGFLLPGHTVSNSPDRWFPLTRIFSYFDGLENDADEPDNEEDEDDDFDWEAELERFAAEQEARRDEKEEELKQAADQAKYAYYEYCFQREMGLVKALLEEHMAPKSSAE